MGHLKAGGGCGSIFGTVSLGHEVTDPEHCGMVDEVSAAHFGIAVGTHGVRPQGLAELQIKVLESRVQMRSQGHKISGAFLDSTRRVQLTVT